MFDFSPVALRGRCLGSFRAPNPWEDGAVDHWTVHVYKAAARDFMHGAHARLEREAVPAQQLAPAQWPQRLRLGEAIGIESSDARHHVLPDGLEALCRGGALPLERLPMLLHGCERTLVRSDFAMHWPKRLLKVLAPTYALLAIVPLALGMRDAGFAGVYFGIAALLFVPLAAWPLLALHWRIRAARLQRRLITLLKETAR